MGHRVTVHCPAKVNLGLEVLHRRADGFHDICTVMQAIDLYDELTVEIVDGDGSEAPDIEVGGAFAGEVPPTGNTLLAAWAVAGGNKLPALRVSLVKNIPAGAGLGGGSSDGAGMLVAMREVLLLEEQASGSIPTRVMRFLASRIGSDAPFFLDGGCQLAEGRGEQLTPIARRLDFHLVIGVPHFGSATGPAYNALHRTEHLMTPMLVPQLARALQSGDMELLKASVVNDFEPVLRQRHPQYTQWLDVLTAHGALAASITGSGSGFFGVFKSRDNANDAVEALDASQFRMCAIHGPIPH